MTNEIKVPETILLYAQKIAKEGRRILWLTKEDVDNLREEAIKHIRRYKEANEELFKRDKDQEEAKAWLISLGIEIKESESCKVEL